MMCWCIASFNFGKTLEDKSLMKEGVQLLAFMLEDECITNEDTLQACVQAVF
jgi:hypothetical protein